MNMKQTNLIIACVLALAGSGMAQGYTWRQCLNAIRQVETGGSPNGGIGAIGDKGKALGPYQIWKPYHIDSGVRGKHEQCLKDKKYSEAVVAGYMKRYARREYDRLRKGKGTIKDVLKVARIHNGGPRGHLRRSTIRYGEKVRRALRDR
jgi:hypothetical protein